MNLHANLSVNKKILIKHSQNKYLQTKLKQLSHKNVSVFLVMTIRNLLFCFHKHFIHYL